jgi:Response regulator containing a CheY-like receiver domain and an HTH DNA-binding domain
VSTPRRDSPWKPIRLLIVDDHDILRYGLRSLLRTNEELQVVGEAGSVAEAIERSRELVPDVILMDARLPDGSGIDACREILSAQPGVRVLFFSAHSDEQTVLMTLVAGAHGHVSKDADLAALVDAIRAVAMGGSVIEERVRTEVLALLETATRVNKPEPVSQALSPQEERVMALVVAGKTNKEIAAALTLSEKTVKNYLYNAFQKLGVGRRAQAASLFDIQRLRRARAAQVGGKKAAPDPE